MTTIHRVTVVNTGQVIDCPATRTILNAAILAGIDFPYACATGDCAACVSELGSGEVTMLPYGDGALSQEQRQSGRTLACRAQPSSDVTITWLGRARR